MTDQVNNPEGQKPEQDQKKDQNSDQNGLLKNIGAEENLTPEEIEMVKMMSEIDSGKPQAEQSDQTSSQPTVEAAQFENLKPNISPEKRDKKLELLLDLMLPVSIELGRTSMLVKDILGA